jgi:hypothetical protein
MLIIALNDHSTKIKPPTTARPAVKPTLTEVEMAPLLLFELLLLLLLLAVALVTVALVTIANPVELPELLDGVVELGLEFLALARKASKVLFAFALTAKTIPCWQ